jgi:hypothetical protein
VIWQARHGWPQIDVSLLLVSPLLAPVWIAGLVRLFRVVTLRDVR